MSGVPFLASLTSAPPDPGGQSAELIVVSFSVPSPHGAGDEHSVPVLQACPCFWHHPLGLRALYSRGVTRRRTQAGLARTDLGICVLFRQQRATQDMGSAITNLKADRPIENHDKAEWSALLLSVAFTANHRHPSPGESAAPCRAPSICILVERRDCMTPVLGGSKLAIYTAYSDSSVSVS